MLFIILLIVLCLLVSYSLYLRFSYKGRLFAKLPGPRRLPLLGNGLDFAIPEDELFLLSRTLYQKYGPVIGLTAINLFFINIYDPEDLEVILSNPKFNDKQQPYSFLKPWLAEGLLVSNGSKWQKRRKLLTQAFHFNILKKYFQTFLEQTEVFLEKVEIEVDKTQTDLLPLTAKMTLQVMCETTMGTSMTEGQSVVNKYLGAIHRIGQIVVLRLSRLLMFYEWSFNLSKTARQQKKILQDLHKFTMQIIHERKAYLEKNPIENVVGDENKITNGRLSMLDLLLQNEKNGKIDINGIREEVDTFLFEGHDTTAMAFCFICMQIANDTTVQNKIYDELKSIFGDSDRPPTTDDLAEMKYLECCIKETLRLYPSVPIISRFINHEVKLGNNYTIPPGTICYIHIYDIHRRADLYPDPDKFIPERFLPENSANRHPFAYIPFSAGPRNCIGQKFAMLEMKTLISGLIRRYRIEAVTKASDINYICDLVLRSSHPIYVRFRNRK